MRTFPGRSQRLTRSHSCRLHDRGVDLKRRPPKSRPAAPPSKTYVSARGRGPQGLRRPRFSFFLFTCQTARDQGRSRSPVNRRAVEACGLRSGSEAWSPNISEELRRRAVAPRRRRAELNLYRRSRPQMSTPRRGENPPSRCNPATGIFLNDIGGLAGVERRSHAVLRPHSSVPLVGAVGGVTSGGTASTSHDPRRTAPPID